MAAPETVAASSATRLILNPSPKPKLKLALVAGEKSSQKALPSDSPKKLTNGLNDINEYSNGGAVSTKGNSRASPLAHLEPAETPKASHSVANGLNATPPATNDRAQQYYHQVIALPVEAVVTGTPNATTGSRKPTASAPKLTKEGYFCDPPIEQLRDMDPADLAAVSNFCVIRPGVGKIEWEGAVDVRGADLDKDIIIEPRSVSVYTDEEEENNKPQVGTKLNRPAILTMEGVFPPADSDPGKFSKKVAKQTARMHAELISYDPSVGEWTLRVMHF
jgi:nuclear pore complex protein Nup98-Nup96